MNTDIKYRPKEIDEFVFCSEKVEKQIRRFTKNKTNEHLILHGPPGTGKSLLTELIPKAIEGNNVIVSRFKAEDLNSNKEVRNVFERSKHFDSLFRSGGQQRGYTVIEEVNFNPKAKGALRTVFDDMRGREQYFITTNELKAIDIAIQSRCRVIEIQPATPEKFLKRAKVILESEGVLISESKLLTILEAGYAVRRDNRKYYRLLDELIENYNEYKQSLIEA